MMKHLKAYKIFENSSSSGLNPEQISFLDGITDKWTYDESTGLVDVDGDFKCYYMSLEDFMGINFGTIRGDFVLDSYQMSDTDGRAVRNVIHASGSVEEAKGEIDLWFSDKEVIKYRHIQDAILYDVNLDGILE